MKNVKYVQNKYTCNVKIKCKKTFHNKDNVVEKTT